MFSQKFDLRVLVPDFDLELCLLFVVLKVKLENICKIEEFFYNPSKIQQESQNINTSSIKSKDRTETSNQAKQKNLLPGTVWAKGSQGHSRTIKVVQIWLKMPKHNA